MKKFKIKKIDPREIIAKIAPFITKITSFITKIAQDRNKLILAIFVILVVLYLYFSFVLKSQIRAVAEIKPKIVKLVNDLNNLDSDLVRMQRRKKGVVSGQIKRVESADRVSWIIEEISRLAAQQEVKILQVEPGQQLPAAGFSNTPIQAEKYSPVLIGLKLSAGYHQLGRFLADLENHPVFLQVENLNIKRANEEMFNYEVKLSLKTYVSRE